MNPAIGGAWSFERRVLCQGIARFSLVFPRLALLPFRGPRGRRPLVVSEPTTRSGCVKGSRTPVVAGRVPRTRSAGVGEASGEETAGGLGAAVRAVLWLDSEVKTMPPIRLRHLQLRTWQACPANVAFLTLSGRVRRRPCADCGCSGSLPFGRCRSAGAASR